MGPLDVLWHVGNLMLPALSLGVLSTTAAKFVWRRELANRAWKALAGPACAASCAVVLVGLVALGRDGKMATYGAMVVACALTLWWQGFGPGRR